MPLLITDLSHRVLQYPYHLDIKNPLTLPEFSALNFFNEIFAGCLSMNDSVLTRDYMTMAAKFAIAARGNGVYASVHNLSVRILQREIEQLE